MTRRLATFASALLVATASVAAQPETAVPSADGVLADPIRCWWRTGAGAVRVGEVFDAFLTCAVLETESVTVVPDVTALDPEAVPLLPFEVLGGDRLGDVRTADRRFFQYRYELRLIVEDAFGQDVELPSLAVSYRIRSRGSQGTSIEGRDQTFVLPPVAVRVLSLVPEDLTDIRDSSGASLGEIESRTLRGRMLLVLGAALVLIGLLMAIATAVGLSGASVDRSRTAHAMLSNVAVLRGVRRELAAIGRDRQAQGWTDDLVARALSALRVAATLAASGRVVQRPLIAPVGRATASDAAGGGGSLRLRGGWFGARTVQVSGWETAESLGRGVARGDGGKGGADERARLETLRAALASFTRARYGRDESSDPVALDRLLVEGSEVVRRLEFEQRWPVRVYRRVERVAAALRSLAWKA